MRADARLFEGFRLTDADARAALRDIHPAQLTNRELDDLSMDLALEYLDTGSEEARLAHQRLFDEYRQFRPVKAIPPCECCGSRGICQNTPKVTEGERYD